MLSRVKSIRSESFRPLIRNNEITNKFGRRGVTMWAWRGGAGIVGLLATYVTMLVILRTNWMQKRHIKKRLNSPKMIESKSSGSGLWVERSDKMQWLSKTLTNNPSGPIIVTGPSGCGKSTIIQKCLAGRDRMTWYVDLREHPIQSGSDFIYTIIEEFGYLLPPSEILARSVLSNFGAGGGRSRVDPIESSKALNLFIEVLEQMQKNNSGESTLLPVLCIDHIDFNINNHINLKADNRIKSQWLNDEIVLNFINWCLFLTDQRLCHVIFTMSMDAAHQLDSHKGLRLRREIMFVDYPRSKKLWEFLDGPVNNKLLENNQIPLKTWEKEKIITTAGGHLKDLDVVLAALFNDRSWNTVLDRLVADSIDFVELYMESIIERAEMAKLNLKTSDVSPFHNKDSPAYWYSKYERFWRIIDCFSNRKYVTRRFLAMNIMESHSEELNELVEEEILISMNFKMMTRTENIEKRPRGILQQNFEGRQMGVNSPRLRLALQVLSSSNDTALKQTRKFAQDMIHHYQLLEKEKILEKKYAELKYDRDFLQRELDCAIKYENAWDNVSTIKAQRNVLNVQMESTKIQLNETRDMNNFYSAKLNFPPYKPEPFVVSSAPASLSSNGELITNFIEQEKSL